MAYFPNRSGAEIINSITAKQNTSGFKTTQLLQELFRNPRDYI